MLCVGSNPMLGTENLKKNKLVVSSSVTSYIGSNPIFSAKTGKLVKW